MDAQLALASQLAMLVQLDLLTSPALASLAQLDALDAKELLLHQSTALHALPNTFWSIQLLHAELATEVAPLAQPSELTLLTHAQDVLQMLPFLELNATAIQDILTARLQALALLEAPLHLELTSSPDS